MQRLSLGDLVELSRSCSLAETIGGEIAHPVVVLHSGSGACPPASFADDLGSLPCVLVAEPGSSPTLLAFVDVAPSPAELKGVLNATRNAPRAAIALALLLRGSDVRTVDEGLVAESTTYSMLQSGPEFQAWRQRTPARRRSNPTTPPLSIEREGQKLTVSLNRPEVHNAYSSAMRDALVEALALALVDDTVEVQLRGNGPSFCSGGDLDEFGSFTDPASAHLVRLTRSAARLLARLAPRVTARVHGACMGSGIELAAFAHRVTAHPDTLFALPELSLGLIPGAGGTVSLPQRMGRQRTMLLALRDAPIDASTALNWGLIDEISD